MIGETPDWEHPQTNRELPRWLQIPSGIVLGSFTILCTYASLVMLFSINQQAPLLAPVVAVVLLLGCIWVLRKCFRLVVGRKTEGDYFFSPNTLRVVSYFLLLFILAGAFTGYYRTMGPIAIFQAFMYLSGFIGLQRLARYRQSRIDSPEPHKPDCEPS